MDILDTIMLWAISDLDGDAPPTNINEFSCYEDPRQWDGITILGRAMYFKDGEVQSGAGILRVNVGD